MLTEIAFPEFPGYTEFLLDDGTKVYHDRKSGEDIPSELRNLPVGSVVLTPRKLAAQEKYREQQEYLERQKVERSEQQKILGKYVFAATDEETFRDLFPDLLARAVYLAAHLDFDSDTLWATQRTPVKRSELHKTLRLSESATDTFWENVKDKYFYRSEDGCLHAKSQVFAMGHLAALPSIEYQKIYTAALRELYEKIPSRQHKRLGYALKMLGHLLRKVNDIIDFSLIYGEVENSYCRNNGRPSIDPVVLIKFLLTGFLYGINSERRISEEIQVNMAYRWFLGLDIMDKVPDHSTISQNRRRRFNGSCLFRNIFQKTVTLCIEKGLADGKLVFTDSTHIKANASRKTEYIKQVEEVTNEYLEELDQYEEAIRNQLESEGKIEPVSCRIRKEKTEIINRRESRTDPESGFYKRKGKAQGMHYLSHETVDSKNCLPGTSWIQIIRFRCRIGSDGSGKRWWKPCSWPRPLLSRTSGRGYFFRNSTSCSRYFSRCCTCRSWAWVVVSPPSAAPSPRLRCGRSWNPFAETACLHTTFWMPLRRFLPRTSGS